MTDGHTERLESALAGRYKIERKLGEGGMASVYLAQDVKHERRVAVKILRPELAAVIGAERFLSEIKTTANLQHPHILPLFDSGEADRFLYYVMPYIEGETLRDKLDREQQLGVDEAVRIARDVADALDYAHRKDIIHRDIKPANILLHEGRPVVADFGIALAISAAGGGRMTETGLSLGTPHYMSPEQASADRDLSARSDVYSLGCVLYEMLAGQPPHTGPSAQSILVRILTEDPRPITDVRRSVPPNVAATITKAIEKLPADRFETAKQFMEALEDPGFTYEPSTRAVRTPAAARVVTEPSTRSPGVRRWLPWAVAAVLALIAGWGWLRPDAPPRVRRLAMVLDSAGAAFGPSVVISPDGSRVVYVGTDGTSSRWTAARFPRPRAAPHPSSHPTASAWAFIGGRSRRARWSRSRWAAHRRSTCSAARSTRGARGRMTDGSTSPPKPEPSGGYAPKAAPPKRWRTPSRGGGPSSQRHSPGDVWCWCPPRPKSRPSRRPRVWLRRSSTSSRRGSVPAWSVMRAATSSGRTTRIRSWPRPSTPRP